MCIWAGHLGLGARARLSYVEILFEYVLWAGENLRGPIGNSDEIMLTLILLFLLGLACLVADRVKNRVNYALLLALYVLLLSLLALGVP